MKTLAIATTLGLAALVGSTASAQYGTEPAPLPPVPTYGSDGVQVPRIVVNSYPEGYQPSPAPLAVDPNLAEETYDEDGYDIDYDLTYDTAAAENYDDGYDPNAYQQFQSELAPYGEWQDDPNYGEVWSPSAEVVGGDFSPYATGGHWVMTEYGWTWVSDYGWGWAPFHYGRWIDRAGYGWCWVPGSVWGPAWVGWRSGGGYAGWAPLPPRGVTVGPPRGVRSPWHFTLAHDLGSLHPGYLPTAVLPSVFGHTSVVTNLRTASTAGLSVRFNAGPSSSVLRTPIQPVPLRTLAPRVLPRPTVTPRAGMPLQARPWFHGGVNPAARPSAVTLSPAAPGPRSVTLGVRPQPLQFGRPLPMRSYPQSRPYGGSLTVVRPGVSSYGRPAYAAPAYRAPSTANHYSAPSYHYAAPAVHYSAPSYSAPSYHYAAPAVHYSAPSYSAPSYSAPSYHYSAPAPAQHYSAPSFSSGGGGGHSFGGGGGGGRHR